jgi:hypothetical protein
MSGVSSPRQYRSTPARFHNAKSASTSARVNDGP